MREKEWQLRHHDPGLASTLIDQLRSAEQTQKDLVEALKSIRAGGNVEISPSRAMLPATAATTAAAALFAPSAFPPPELLEPHQSDLAVAYRRWAVPQSVGMPSARAAYAAYLVEHKRIMWAKLFDKGRANAAKVRYYRMLPFLTYVDSAEAIVKNNQLVDDRERVLQELQGIMTAHGMDAPKFIKNCFYSLANNSSLESPLAPSDLAAAMQRCGLPLPTNGAT
jgi:hypothetical protein